VTRQDFSELFLAGLDRAAASAEAQLCRAVPRRFGILRGSPGPDGRRISVEEALSELWISEDRFYRVIDLAPVEVLPSITWVWVRESGHPPSAFDETWNEPRGSGPFKVLVPAKIRDAGENHTAV
jgi:hypothetical protein